MVVVEQRVRKAPTVTKAELMDRIYRYEHLLVHKQEIIDQMEEDMQGLERQQLRAQVEYDLEGCDD